MKPKESVISLIGFCVLTTFGAALSLAVIVAGGSVALADHRYSSDEQQEHSLIAQSGAQLPLNPAVATFNGMITDSYCGARHLRSSRQSPAECARACVRKGAPYVLVDGDRRYQLTGQDEVLDKLAGQRVNVTGTLEGGTIAVTSAAPISLP